MDQIHCQLTIDFAVIDYANTEFVFFVHRDSIAIVIAVVSMIPVSCSAISSSRAAMPFDATRSRAVFNPSRKIDFIKSPDFSCGIETALAFTPRLNQHLGSN